jgi:hypothetical protein
MTDPKTTASGLATALAFLLSQLHIVIPDSWGTWILAVGIFITSFFAKDKASGGSQ